MKNFIAATFAVLFLWAGMASAQTITVTSPNGGENLDGCISHTVSWTASGTSNSYSIDYSIDNGANWTSVASFLVSATGTFSWTVPNISSSSCLIRVYDSNDPLVIDVSDAVFSINGPLILQFPNGGEAWVANTQQTISWAATGTSNVYKLEYSTNNGGAWSTIVNNYNSTTGSYLWTVPNLNTAFALVRITDVNNAGCVIDKSDTTFSILSDIQLTAPNGGQTFQATVGTNGQLINMSNGNETASVGNFYDNGGEFGNYSSNLSFTKTFYPEVPTQKLRLVFTEFETYNSGDYIRIYDGTSTSSANLLGQYSGTQTPGSFTSTHKTGALTVYFRSDGSGTRKGWEAYFTTVGEPAQTIDWDITGTSGVFDLELSTNAGASWNRIVENYPSTTGEFEWQVPNYVTSTARVRVVDAGNTTIGDPSNTNFAITAADPTMLYCTPVGGSVYYAGSNVNVTWASAFTTNANVDIEYSTNNGTNWLPVITTVNDGSYIWSLPNTPTSTALLRVSETGNAAVTDMIDTTFTIKPHVRITSPNAGQTFNGCGSLNIYWEHGGTSNYFTAEASLDGGTTWIPIRTNFYESPNLGSEGWSIPNTNSSSCLIRVYDYNDPTKGDTVDLPLTITETANIEILQPNGGNTWVAGGTFQCLYMTFNGVNNVDIALSLDSGATWVNYGNNITGGLFDIDAPNVSTEKAMLRITDDANSCNVDYSDSVFTIISEVDLTAPNGGQSYMANSLPVSGVHYISNTADVTLSTGTLYDDGGPSGNYQGSRTYIKTFYPSNPTSKLRLIFTEFETYNSSDYVRIYDGPTTSGSALLGTWSGSNSPGTLTSSHKTGALTVYWRMGSGQRDLGMKAHFTSINAAVPNAPITWDRTGTSGEFDLDYSTNGGTTWSTIVRDYGPVLGEFSWPVPDIVTDSAVIRIMDAGNSAIVDQSDAYFDITMAMPEYLLCVPNGGTSHFAGYQMSVEWAKEFTQAPFARLEYTIDSGATWILIDSLAINDGQYDWVLPNVNSDDCMVRVIDGTNSVYRDQSDGVFSIRPYLTVTVPNTALTWTACQNNIIRWTNGNTSNFFNIDYSTDGGTTWNNIIQNYQRTSQAATYTWSTPNLSSTNCLIRVTDANDANRTDVSDVPFTIVPTQNIQVVSPNGGENLVGGLSYPITYTTQGGVSNVKIEYSTNAGTSWITLSNSTSGGSFNWNVPFISSTQTQIRISDATGGCSFDESDSTFVILGGVNVTHPNGGEVLPAVGGLTLGGDYRMNVNTSDTITTGNLYDDRGPTSNYQGYIVRTRSFYPENPIQKMRVEFSEFETYHTSDYLSIYDGPTTSSAFLIGTYSGNSIPPSVTSSHPSGALTFYWRTDNSSSTVDKGFKASLMSYSAGNDSITWTVTGTSGEYSIDYSINSGATWTNLVDYHGGNLFTWPVPNTPTTNAKVRVRDTQGSTLVDESDSVFTIGQADPIFVLTNPNGGSFEYAGNTENITWLSAFTTWPYVKLEYSADSGATWQTIVSQALNNGLFPWTVPNVNSNDVLVRVSDATNPAFFDVSDAVFTINPYITVTDPNGGGTWTGCSTRTIRWNKTSSSTSFDIDYSLDSGATWVSIATNHPASGTIGTYNWNLPNVSATQCLVRVTDSNNPTRTDVSDSVFSIVPTQNIQVTSPNGGENLVGGLIFPITFTTQGGVSSVEIEASTNNGASWFNVTTNTTASTGLYNWTVPYLASSNQALIRITDRNGGCSFDVSDAVFNILGEVVVKQPNGGETLTAVGGTVMGGDYRMNANSIDTISTGNLYDDRGPNSNYAGYIVRTRTFYPENPTHKMRVEFTDFRTYHSSDYLSIYNGPSTSSSYLVGTYSSTNIPPSFTSTHSTGALTFYWRTDNSSSSVQEGFKAALTSYGPNNDSITWSRTGTSGEYTIDYSINGGSNWTNIIDYYNDTTFSWPVPNTPTNFALVRVRDTYGSALIDQSDSVFNIGPATPIYILNYPNGGNNLYAGNNANITWTSAFSTWPYVKLEYSADSGATWQTIVGQTLNSGTYPWILPNINSNDVLVRVSDPTNSALTDQSNGVFTVNPFITIASPNGGNVWTGCSNRTISWAKSSSSTNFDIDYSLDNGGTWTAIATNYPASGSSGSYTWSLPNVSSTNCLVRVTDSNNPARTDVSDSVFTILPTQNIQVVSPNGGENWVDGLIYPITYTTQGGVSSVKIEYSLNGGTTWGTITNSTSGGNYNWTIPYVSSEQALIRISDASGGCSFDVSDTTFNILGEVVVNEPNGGEFLTAVGGSVIGGDYRMNVNSTDTISTGNLYDDRGPNSNYAGYLIRTRTFYPENPTHKMSVEFADFETYNTSDYLRVYAGPSTSSSYLVGNYSGSALPPKITSTHSTGALTFQWRTDNSNSTVAKGFKAALISKGADNDSISWNVSGTSGEYSIDYSLNSGGSWINIVDYYSDTTFSWPVPNTPTSTAKVRVRDTRSSQLADESDSVFTIGAATPIYILRYPNGGNNLYAGNTANITWVSAFSTWPYARLEYSPDNGATWQLIVNQTINDGSYPWVLPNVDSDSVLVRVSDPSNTSLNDVSDGVFRINPYITITDPNGGGTWVGCTNRVIRWSKASSSTIFDVEYSLDGGSNWTNIVSNYSQSSTNATYSWTLPNVNSTNALIRVTDANDPSKFDISDAPFTISSINQVTVNTPNGGELMVAGTQQNIIYTIAGGVSSVTLAYSINNGVSWSTIATSQNNGNYLWTVPNLPSDSCLIRAYGNTCHGDTSDGVFTILSDVTLTSPNGGEIWQAYVGQSGAQVLLNDNTPVTLNSGNLYDNGGEFGNYLNGYRTHVKTIYPDIPGNKVTVDFQEFETYNSSDYLRIYDGPSASSTFLVGTYSSTNTPPIVTSTHATGALTFYWRSDNSNVDSGFEAILGTVGTPPQNISWNITGTSGKYDLQYSTNGGATYSTIMENYETASGIYPWQIPNTPSTTCLFQVIDASNGNIVDVSDNYFEIKEAQALMTIPNGGESVYSGVPFEIKWIPATYLTTNVKLEYSINGGVSWTLIEPYTFNDGSYLWNPPQTTVSYPNCLVRVSEFGNSVTNDVSDANFSLNPAIRITSPNGNSGSFRGCTQSTVAWVAGASTNYRIELSVDSGTTWAVLESNYANSANVVNYNWTIPNTPSSNCLVRVTDINNPSRTDVSDAVFTIDPTVIITQPNYGGQIQGGTSYMITWSSNVVSNFYDIDFSTNGGSSWTNIVTNHFTTSDSYNWSVPSTVSNNCLIRVRDNLNTCKEDISDQPFTIQSSAPAITITAPNGGDTLAGCSTEDITWTVLSSSNFYNIEYSVNAGVTWTTIAGNYYTTGSTFSWNVPNISSELCLVRVTDATDPNKTDVSNLTFTIEESVSANVTVSGPTSICLGDTVYLTSASATGNVWAPFGQTAQTIAVTSSGSYSVSVTNAGCVATSVPVNVSVNPLPPVPTISANGPTAVCAGSSLVLTSSSPSGNLWTPTSQTTQAISVSQAGQYSVRVTNQFGCYSNSAPVSVTVTPLPLAPVAGANTPVPVGGTINLTASNIPNAIYTWAGPNGFSSNVQNPSLTNASTSMTGTYFVTATVNGCTGPAGNVQVVVNPNSAVVNISGQVKSELGSPVRSTTLNLTGAATANMTTGVNGLYDFDLTSGQAYDITPVKNNDTISNNGITTLDLIFMRRHILNADTLDTPYKILAADVNLSGNVTTLDLVLTRTVILQTNLAFPNNRLWTFVSTDYSFPNPISPWPYSEGRSYANAANAAGQDFYGIKLGDVNNTWDPNTARTPFIGELNLILEDAQVSADQELIVPVRVADFTDISGYQFTLEWDATKLEYLGVENGLLNGYFGESKVAQGKLATSWEDELGGAISLEDGSVIFNARFKVKGKMEQSTHVYIGSGMANAEAYNDDLKRLSLKTRAAQVSSDAGGQAAEAATDGYYLSGNFPNPFEKITELTLRVPEAVEMEFSIFDLNGQEVRSFAQQFEAGEHTVRWDGSDANGNQISNGVYYIRAQNGEFSATRKMILMRP